MPRYHCVVRGKVQGVFYRQSTLEQAQRLGLAGWVRNLPDGTVEAVLEGPAEGLRRMVAWMSQGPPGARVEKVEVAEEPEEGLAGFTVRR